MARTISFFIIGILILESRMCLGLDDLSTTISSKIAFIHDRVFENYSPKNFSSFQDVAVSPGRLGEMATYSREVIDHFDHLKDQHVNTIWLNSIFPRTRNLSVTNYMDVHQGLGSMSDFERLLKGAHKLGMKVILAVMPYETSDQHPWFQKWSRNESPYNNFYVTLEEKPPRDSNGWSDERQIGYLQKFPHTPCLDLANQEVRRQLNKEIFEFWLNKGVDGFIVEGLWQYLAYSKGVFPYAESIVENNKGYLQKVRKFMDRWTLEHNSTFKYFGARFSEPKDTQAASGARPDETVKLTVLFSDLKDQLDIIPTSITNETPRALNVAPRDSVVSSSIVLRSLRVKRAEEDKECECAKKCTCSKTCGFFERTKEMIQVKWAVFCKWIVDTVDNLKCSVSK